MPSRVTSLRASLATVAMLPCVGGLGLVHPMIAAAGDYVYSQNPPQLYVGAGGGWAAPGDASLAKVFVGVEGKGLLALELSANSLGASTSFGASSETDLSVLLFTPSVHNLRVFGRTGFSHASTSTYDMGYRWHNGITLGGGLELGITRTLSFRGEFQQLYHSMDLMPAVDSTSISLIERF